MPLRRIFSLTFNSSYSLFLLFILFVCLIHVLVQVVLRFPPEEDFPLEEDLVVVRAPEDSVALVVVVEEVLNA